MKYCENYQNVTQRHKVNKYCWKNGTNRLAQYRIATNLQFIKNAISAKGNTMRSACVLQNNQHDMSSYHLSLYKVNTILLALFPLLYITSSWFIYFITGSLYLLIPFTHFAHPPTFLPSSNQHFVLSMNVGFVCFVL